MNKRGMVTKVEGNKLHVIMTRSSACGDCSSCGGCEAETISINVENDINAVVGDFVEIEYNKSNMLKSTILVYIFPLIMLVLGVITGLNLNTGLGPDSKELLSFLMGVCFMGISYFIINKVDKKVKANRFFTVKKLENLF